jgi:hypothetical protein
VKAFKDNFIRRIIFMTDDRKKESQLAQAEQWLNDVIDPSADDKDKDEEKTAEEKDKNEEKTSGRSR